MSSNAASDRLLSTSAADKIELLEQNGIIYDDIPNWQKRGVGLYWGTHEKTKVNAKTQEPVTASRKKIFADYDLPTGNDYNEYIYKILST